MNIVLELEALSFANPIENRERKNTQHELYELLSIGSKERHKIQEEEEWQNIK